MQEEILADGVTESIFVGISRKGNFDEKVTFKAKPRESGVLPKIQSWRKPSKQQAQTLKRQES